MDLIPIDVDSCITAFMSKKMLRVLSLLEGGYCIDDIRVI